MPTYTFFVNASRRKIIFVTGGVKRAHVWGKEHDSLFDRCRHLGWEFYFDDIRNVDEYQYGDWEVIHVYTWSESPF